VIVDASAVIAILRAEPEAEHFAALLADAAAPRMSVVNHVEAAVVIDAVGDPVASRRLDDLVAASGIALESVTAEQGTVARAAYRDFGKGSGHPAGLNFGDCFAYALARLSREPLLFKGDDFVHTDIWPAS